MICDISCKALIGSKPLLIRYDKIDIFIKIFDETRYLTLFGSGKYDAIYNRIRYLISLKSGVTFIFLYIFLIYILYCILQKSRLIFMVLCL